MLKVQEESPALRGPTSIQSEAPWIRLTLQSADGVDCSQLKNVHDSETAWMNNNYQISIEN